MIARNTPKRRSRGAALIMALLLVAIVSMGAAAVWEYLHMTLKEGHRTEIQETTFCLAEAGLDKAIATLRTRANYNGEKDTPLGDGHFSVQVTPEAAPGQYQLKSVAILGEENRVQAQCTLRASLRLSPRGEVVQYQYRMEPGGR
jgi:type II secretory pathway component PulK